MCLFLFFNKWLCFNIFCDLGENAVISTHLQDMDGASAIVFILSTQVVDNFYHHPQDLRVACTAQANSKYTHSIQELLVSANWFRRICVVHILPRKVTF